MSTVTVPAPRVDDRTAQDVATALVAQALTLHPSTAGALVHHGDWWEIDSEIRTNARPGQLDGIISFTITDEGNGSQVAVTLMVATTPLTGGDQ